MSYLGYELYVRDECRRLAAERENLPARFHAEWLAEQKPVSPPAHRALLQYAGDRLIAIGERLQSWSATRLAE
jgi:hypothetical protein